MVVEKSPLHSSPNGSERERVYASYPAVALLVSVMGMPASATSWKREPFKEGVPLCYRAVFDTEQFVRVKTGLIPEAMEDKWFIYYEEPHLFLHRSWTGQPVYRLTLKSEPKGAEVSEALWSKDIADASALGPDYEVRLLDFLISNLLLGLAKPFPMPPGLTEPKHGVYQHHIAGTYYPQSPTKPEEAWSPPKPKKAWWHIR
jgi:hypothetical protein